MGAFMHRDADPSEKTEFESNFVGGSQPNFVLSVIPSPQGEIKEWKFIGKYVHWEAPNKAEVLTISNVYVRIQRSIIVASNINLIQVQFHVGSIVQGAFLGMKVNLLRNKVEPPLATVALNNPDWLEVHCGEYDYICHYRQFVPYLYDSINDAYLDIDHGLRARFC
jgi:hypothetical protein